MQSDYTHLTVILDRSGSMESIRDDTIGGFNAFLHEQQAQAGKATLTLVQFDTQDAYEVVHHFQSIDQVPDLTSATFVPRSGTPLLDALGRGINDLEAQLQAIPEAVRPARVVVVVITDGQENSSREFGPGDIQAMIQRKQKRDDWQFVFLSADLGAIEDAIAGGMNAAAVMAFDKNAAGAKAAWASTSKQIANFRAAQAKAVCFSDADRQQQASERKREQAAKRKPKSKS